MPYLVMGFREGNGAPAEGNDDNTRLLVQSDTTEGSTTFTDSSIVGQTIGTAGSVVHRTATSKFGASSLSFETGALTLNSSEFAVGTGDFTYDFWVRTSGWGTTGLLSNGAIGGNVGPMLYTGGSTGFVFYIGYSGSGVSFGSATIAANEWTHVAFVRSSGQAAGAINGTFVAAFATANQNLTNTNMAIGGRYMLGEFPLTNTTIDEFRFSNIARWTSNFTPPTAPYT